MINVPNLVAITTAASAGRPHSDSHPHSRSHSHSATIPPELLRSIPREVVLNGSGKVAAVTAIVFLVGAIAAFVGLGLQAIRDRDLREVIAREGVPVQAQVLTVRRTRGDNPRQVIRYRFIADGVAHENTASLRLRKRSSSLSPGDTIHIRYQRTAPENNWVAGFEPSGFPLWAVPLMSLGLLTVPLGLWHSIRQQHALLREGRPALAKVVGGKSHGHGKPYQAEFEFRDLSGSHHTGRHSVTQELPAGSTLAIVYDREYPAKSAVYPFSLVRVDVPPA